MAIDVQSEAKRIAMNYSNTGHEERTAVAGGITSLVTRAVADAKLKQMEADCKAVCVKCKFGFNSLDHSMCCQNIRTAFAATDRQSIRECNSCEKQSSAAAWAGDVCPMCEENNAKAETEPRLSPDEVFRLAHEPDAPRAFMEIANRAHAEHEKATEPKIVHGLTCNKAPHTRDGYLHGEDYDGPYDVDGLEYCGRCHVVMPSPTTEPRDAGTERGAA